ncbi:anti-anti-sigma factor [Geodermatophilus telluris]|uniref:Anti-anti-sigma factor n=1 Tax=Geodermatophilus telluris TaxID=1190417 RepID=A0A1G6MVU7_9ACTN|nr:STAS domain-containing protein [Geodermatophilus telluris]SDC59669.1 anti-anti-sigma factor [Geodermatophilus telluris]
MHLSVAVVPAPDQVVVRLTGDAGRPTLPRLVPALTTAAGHGTASIVVDVACARFRDGSALEALAGFSDAMAAAGRRLRLVGAPAATRRLVTETGLADHLELDGPLTGQDPVRPRPHRVSDTQPVVAVWPGSPPETRRSRPLGRSRRGAGLAVDGVGGPTVPLRRSR